MLSYFCRKIFRMQLENILAISGKPGLYKMVSNVGTAAIVQSLLDGKRMPVNATHKVSALEDIAIYTYDEDIPLSEVFDKIYDKESGGPAISHKSPAEELRDYMGEVLPKFDEERVYSSDLKKLFQWYNLLQKQDMLIREEADTGSSVVDAEIIEESSDDDKEA